MDIKSRIELLAELGHYLLQEPDDALEAQIALAYAENRWFTPENTRAALQAIARQMLDKKALENWTQAYKLHTMDHPVREVGIVMAGNIPLVGFHDWLSVFASGHRARVKLSDKDKRLLPFLVKKMGEWEKSSWAYTEFMAEGQPLRGFEAVIATGSNNTARYFEQYFAKYPHIIRRNRNSVAVLNGQESEAEIQALGRDIFSYFGLGCRNVGKLYVPVGYDFEPMLEVLHQFREIIHHDKYKNNFDYNLTLFILNQMPYKNNGCLLMREEESLTARIASVHYAFYPSTDQLAAELLQRREAIQCLVGNMDFPGMYTTAFGKTQEPSLMDYPDGIDVMAWLEGLG